MEQENLPKHIAIIMDGNRRWARNKGLPVGLGHKEGAKTLEKIVRYAKSIGIKYITGSVQEKANFKATMIPYLVGVALLVITPTIVRIIYELTTQAIE